MERLLKVSQTIVPFFKNLKKESIVEAQNKKSEGIVIPNKCDSDIIALFYFLELKSMVERLVYQHYAK